MVQSMPTRGEVRAFRIIMTVLTAFVVLRAAAAYPTAGARLAGADNDDILRMMSVRDWLAGQGWFDMTQHRLLPPDGISMHWSRYVDAGIAGLVVAASWIVGPAQAEAFALVAWPSLLLVALIGIVGVGTRRLAGPVAGSLAMVTAVAWLPIGGLQFLPGRIDHHNVQIVAATVLAFALAGPGGGAARGVVAGLAAASSLAVGLETLPLIAAAGVLVAVRADWRAAEAERLAAGFCVALPPATVILLAGQTAPADWFVPRCDALAMPVVALAFAGSLACLVPLVMLRRARPVLRLLATAGLALAALWLLMPLLAPCVDGPYGQLPQPVRDLIATGITEAQSAARFAAERPASFNAVLTPAVGTVLIAAFFLVRGRGGPARDGVAQMLVLALVGILGTAWQIRMVNLAAAAVPFLSGFVWSCLWTRWRAGPTPRMAAILLGCGLATLLAPLPGAFGAGARPADRAPGRGGCRSVEAMAELAALPPSRILTPLNLGAPLILLTRHAGLSAPYHRSAAAFADGAFPFEDPAAMREALARTGADVVALCASDVPAPEARVARALLAGVTVAGLREVPVAGRHWRLFAPGLTLAHADAPS